MKFLPHRQLAFFSLLSALLVGIFINPALGLLIAWSAGLCLAAAPQLGAATTYGTAHLYGISGTVSNATVVAVKLDSACGIEDETLDENGIRIEGRYDDVQTTGSLTLRIRASYTVPSPGGYMSFNGTAYEITKVGKSEEQKGFRTIEVNLKKTSAVTPS